MSERIYKLLDGSELICSEEGILSHRLEPDFTAITTDPNAEYMDLLALIDSLQQQVEEYGTTIERQGQEMIRLQGLVNKHLQQAAKWEKAFDNADKNYLKMEHEAAEVRRQLVRKTEELAERHRTIAHLRKSLEATVTPFKFYADPNTYDPAHLDKLGYIIIDEDGGASAKAALAAVLRALSRE